MSEAKLSLEPVFPIRAPYDVAKIIVVGCGGTGSYYIRDLARMVGSLKTKKPEILLIDGDKVEEKNLVRQNFTSADVGRNKAEVQAARYGAMAGQMAFRATYLATVEEMIGLLGGGSNVLVVSCVDNIKTRLLIKQALAAKANHSYWIDCGNEESTGQVIFSYRVSDWNIESIKAGYYPTPDVFDLYPELNERVKADKLPTEMSCAELAVSSPQYGFVNGTAAMLAINFTHALLAKLPIRTYESCFSIDNKFSHKTPTLSALKQWTTFFAPFKGTTLLDKLGKN